MGSERHKLARNETVAVLVTQGTQRWTFEQRGKIKCSQNIKNDNLVGSICVNRVVEREIGRGVVVGEVQSGLCIGERVCETRHPFLEVPFSLGSRDGRTGAVVVVEGLSKSTHCFI